MGEHDTGDRYEGSEAEYRVKNLYQHRRYTLPSKLNNDIAVYELDRPIRFNKYVQPVCLPTGDVAVGTECYITGKSEIFNFLPVMILNFIYTVWKFEYQEQSMQSILVDELNQSALS